MLSLAIHVGYEGSYHCTKNLHNPLTQEACYCLNISRAYISLGEQS